MRRLSGRFQRFNCANCPGQTGAKKDWLSLLTKSSDVNGLTRGKHARFARYRIFQDANFKKKHASS